MIGIQAGDGKSLEKKEEYGDFEKSIRACIRFYQQGKIKGDACLADYFKSEYKGKEFASEREALNAAIVLGMAFEKKSAFKRTLSLCKSWNIEDSKSSLAFAMLAGILSGIIREEKFKQSVNWAMEQIFESEIEDEDDEELTELMKLVVALYESRKDLSKTVKFISDDQRPYKAFGASLLVALRMSDDIIGAVACANSNSADARLASIQTGAMIGAFSGYENISKMVDYETELVKQNIDMARDLYNIIYNDAILPFDKYAPL